MAGHAVTAAASQLATEIRAKAAQIAGGEADDFRLQCDHAVGRDRRVPLSEVVERYGTDGVYSVTEEVQVEAEPVNRETGVANISLSYSFAVQAVEVEVDTTTGEVFVRQAFSVHDSGQVVNPLGFEGQVVGGMAMGLGAALSEELLLQDGRLAGPSMLAYGVPRAADLPRIVARSVGGPDPHGPAGAKGVGEVVLVPTAAAVANAVAHASGVRVRTLPITPDKILRGLGADSGPTRSYGIWRRPSRWWVAVIRALYPRGLHAALHRFGTRFARLEPRQDVQELQSPASLEEASGRLRSPGSAAVGGATDLIPSMRGRIQAPAVLVSLQGVSSLSEIERTIDEVRIGAMVTLATLEEPMTGVPATDLIAATVRQIASPTLRESATLGGNLCQEKRCGYYRSGFDCYKRGGTTCPCYAVEGDHRFHHAVVGAHRCQAIGPSDLATALAALRADVHVADGRRVRSVSIDGLYSGPGETVLRAGELVTRVVVPTWSGAVVGFEKLARTKGDFAVVSVAVALHPASTGEGFDDVSIRLGGLAATPFRPRRVEQVLLKSGWDRVAVANALETEWRAEAHPLPNNAWKLDAASGLLIRTLGSVLGARPEVS